MHDLFLGALVIADALAGLVTSQEFVRVLFGVGVLVGFLLAVVAIIVGALVIARAVLRLVTRRLAR